MNFGTDSPNSDPIREAEVLIEVAEQLHRAADEATERARAACERANRLPLFERLQTRVDRRDREGR
ncbi:MAG: hypothetical protein U1E23_09425 [Reyranellaceae bacterium]